MAFSKNLLNVAAGAIAPPEVSGKALMKQTAKRYGVDISRIPEPAWNELVKNCIDAANGYVAVSHLPGMEDKNNFHTNLRVTQH